MARPARVLPSFASYNSWPAIRFLNAILIALQVPSARGIGGLLGCDSSGSLVISSVTLSPKQPRTNHSVAFDVGIRAAEHLVNLRHFRADVQVQFCRRPDDCMRVYTGVTHICELLEDVGHACDKLESGEHVHLTSEVDIPAHIFRGAYDVRIAIRNSHGDTVACSSLDGVVVTASTAASAFHDYRDAFVAFAVAAGASRAFGVLFPALSGGMLPQISGFLAIGIVVGPYVTNLVTKLHILLIGGWINQLSLAFIAGAAGAEIFYPDLHALIGPIVIHVLLISILTLCASAVGLVAFSMTGVLSLPALDMQDSFVAKTAIALLAGALMTARSPASIIAVIQETGCNKLCIAKLSLGITVLGDIVVLVLYALCTSFTRAATEGGAFGLSSLFRVIFEISASLVLGCLAGQALRLCLPVSITSSSKDHDDHDATTWETVRVGFRGFLLLAILFGTYQLAFNMDVISRGYLRTEPLLACTAASCICGHDSARRHNLEEALGFWTPLVLLPFFTLAGASLELPGLQQVLPAATALVFLRGFGISLGSIVAGALCRERYLNLPLTPESVLWMWSTLLSQAGVTLGLVLETQHSFSGWSRDFGTLIIGVVIINQLIGPVFCRIGLQYTAIAERSFRQNVEEGMELAPAAERGTEVLPAYDNLASVVSAKASSCNATRAPIHPYDSR
eukprot:TRINITY_DN27840_c0_g1_i1.p1 TRINITY_DN27840_c0_g1~~TRINITY_DN27840_c0_g1_i1.p1  ORF type:complete len:693 (-),score=43.47 TRINITY_DN27840_c0_g1_i1:109-2148(-)